MDVYNEMRKERLNGNPDSHAYEIYVDKYPRDEIDQKIAKQKQNQPKQETKAGHNGGKAASYSVDAASNSGKGAKATDKSAKCGKKGKGGKRAPGKKSYGKG